MRVAGSVQFGPFGEQPDLRRGFAPAVAAVTGRCRRDIPAGHRLRAAKREVDEDAPHHHLHVVIRDPGQAAHGQREPAGVGVQRERFRPRLAVVVGMDEHKRCLVAQRDTDDVRIAHEQAAARLDPDDAGCRPTTKRRVGEHRPRRDEFQRTISVQPRSGGSHGGHDVMPGWCRCREPAWVLAGWAGFVGRP